MATARLLGGNTIEDNGGSGVEVVQGALFQGLGSWDFPPNPDIISSNGNRGIFGWNGARLEIRKVTVMNNGTDGIQVGFHSSIMLSGSTIADNTEHGISVVNGSAINLEPPTGTTNAVITGNSWYGVFCVDEESSLTGGTTGVYGNGVGQVQCTGF